MLTINNGGTLNANGLSMGSGTTSVGSVTVSGAGSALTSTAEIVVGAQGTGTLTISDGAVVTALRVDIARGTPGAGPGLQGTLNIGAPVGMAPVAPGTLVAPVGIGTTIVPGTPPGGTGTINFNHTSTDYVFAPAITQGTATGVVNVLAGTTHLTATNTYTGPTTISGGALFVDGSLTASNVTVNGGTLAGIGTVVNNVQVNNGGTFAPGNGTPGSSMTVGSLAFTSGAQYMVFLNSSTSSFANVTGTASLNGTVQVDASSVSNKTYLILHSAGLNGTTFTGIGNPNFAGQLTYTADDVFLTITAAELGNGTKLNVNQQNVSNAINNFFNATGTEPPQFANIFNLTGANLANALTQLSGENAAGAERASFQLMNGFLNVMLDPHVPISCDPRDPNDPLCRQLHAIGLAPEQQASLPPEIALAYGAVFKAPPRPTPVFEQRWTAWASAFGGGSTASGDPVIGSHDVTTTTFGYAAGMDYRMAPGTVLGFALAGGGTHWDLSQALGTGRSDAFMAGIYGKTYLGPVYLAGSAAFANNWFTTDRNALGDQLTASFQGQSYAARFEGGYRFAVPAASNAIGITPYAAVQAQNFRTPTYSETDLTGGGFGLTYAAMNGTDTRSELGARFDDLTAFNAMPLILRGRLAWAHDWVSNPALNASFQALPGTSFTVFGAPIPHDSALVSASAQLFFRPNWSVLVKFDGDFASTSQVYAGTGTLRYTW
jgi:T5SS/PEP-CTERM-associated repeat protein/autotransporter-associated beta strand protein